MTSPNSCYRIRELNADGSVIQLEPEILREFNLEPGQQIQIKFGYMNATARIISAPSPDPPSSARKADEAEIFLSKKVFQQLHLPGPLRLAVKKMDAQQLRLGPVIGILTFQQTYDKRGFNFYLNYHVMLKGGLLFVFAGSALNPINNTIKGYFFSPTAKAWISADLPYPDVVVDRCYPNGYQTHAKLEKCLGPGKIFNKKTMINKLDFFNAVKEDPLLKLHLPETRVCYKASDAAQLLQKYGKIYIKPLTGMKGLGIMTASLAEDGIECRCMDRGQVLERHLANADELLSLLKSYGHPRRTYILQEAISNIGYQGKPFCFRVMVCKNGQGQWLVPAIFTNAATGDSFLTNHAAGASQFVPFKQLFSDLEGRLSATKGEFIKSLVTLGIKTAQALDKKYGPLGELGLDMVVDPSGKPCLLEANGNPGIVPRSHTVDFPNWVQQNFSLPVSYATYLAGF